jgi:hypothetical protein
VLLKVVLEYDRVDEQGEMVHVKGTYVDKEKLGEVDVEITELSGNTDTYIPPEPEPEQELDGGGEEGGDENGDSTEAKENGEFEDNGEGNEDDPEGHHSGKITDGGGKGSGTTDVYLQVITFEMCFDLKKEPIEMQNQAFCDYSMMGYVFVFNNGFETYRIPCNEFNYLTDDETCALLRFTVRWTQDMGILSDEKWKDCWVTLFAKSTNSGSSFIYKLNKFRLHHPEENKPTDYGYENAVITDTWIECG